VSASRQTVLKCEGLTKEYEEIRALDNLNLEISAGKVFGYIGHNGAGKTTTIRILAGLLRPTSGKASVCGIDVSSGRDQVKSIVGYMPDSFGVYDQMRVWEYLDFFGAAFKLPRAKRKERIDYVLANTDSEYMRDRFVDKLSHGMKQRIGIARALIHDPVFLVLDEPLSGLDPRARIQMRQLLRRLADEGKTLMVSSHILAEMAVICDEIGIINKGKLEISGPMQKVFAALQKDRLMEIKALNALTGAIAMIEANGMCSDLDRAAEDKGVLRFRYAGDDEALADLFDAVRRAGTRVVTMREVPLDLEQAYMAVSGIASEHVGKIGQVHR
jgi:ABC-2 type transport system ATP-binding protein